MSVVRYDEATQILWIDAETAADARNLYLDQVQLLGSFGELRGIVYRNLDRIPHMIRNRDLIEAFIRPESTGPSLSELMQQADDPSFARVEIAIHCEKTGRVCFSWENAHALTLWKTDTQAGEDGSTAALRRIGEIMPCATPESLVGLWNTEFDGTSVHFFIACVDREYEIEDGLWVSPTDLRGWKLDRSMVAAFSNSPRLAKLIRRSPA